MALRAAELAIDLAAALGSALTFVTVVEDHMLDARLQAAAIPEAAERRAQGAVTMLSRMTARASLQGLRTHQEVLTGPGAERVLAAAAQGTTSWNSPTVRSSSYPAEGQVLVGGDTQLPVFTPQKVSQLLVLALGPACRLLDREPAVGFGECYWPTRVDRNPQTPRPMSAVATAPMTGPLRQVSGPGRV